MDGCSADKLFLPQRDIFNCITPQEKILYSTTNCIADWLEFCDLLVFCQPKIK